MKNIAVIGGGASGMLAALTAAESRDCHIILFEKQTRVGKKLLATGNGRCNLTNTGAAASTTDTVSGLQHYHGSCPDFAGYALKAFPPADVIAYFRSLGLVCSEQYGGRVYPLSDNAGSVLDVLRFAVDSAEIELHTGETVTGITRRSGRFLLSVEYAEQPEQTVSGCGSRRTCSVDAVIVSCGGLAGGKNGGCNDGYTLLKFLGHHCTKLYPALVPLRTDTDYPRSLKGVRADAELRLYDSTGSGPIAVGRGELQFVEKGISGPAAFDISREASLNGGTVVIDFLRDLPLTDVTALLAARRKRSADLDLSALFTGILHSRLGLIIVKAAGFRPSGLIRELSDADLRLLANTAKSFTLHITGTDSFDSAQITAGGINTEEFDPSTLESRLVPGIYACGEVLDIDGDCGGYNLQWAWASGRLAGMNAAAGGHRA